MADINGTVLDLETFSTTTMTASNGLYQPIRKAEPVTWKVFRMRGIDAQTGQWVFWDSPGKPSWNPFGHVILNPTIVASRDVDAEA
jgi:hypothetical protein